MRAFHVKYDTWSLNGLNREKLVRKSHKIVAKMALATEMNRRIGTASILQTTQACVEWAMNYVVIIQAGSEKRSMRCFGVLVRDGKCDIETE